MHLFMAVLIMGFLTSIFGCSTGDGDSPQCYVSEATFRDNLAKQTTMSPQTVAQLMKHGVTDDTSLKLEFFVYTDKDGKGQELVKALRGLDYTAECGPSAGESRLLLVTGWTTPINMTDSAVIAWTDRMCRLSYEHDCEFDGWGTNPTQ